MIGELRLFFVALQFMTRVPVPRWVGFEPEWLNRSARHFAGVGMLVGGFGAVVLWLAARLWPMPVAVGLSMAATIWLTGAFHEDGFADTCDGLGGAVSRERALEIMKDSRIGAYGAIGIATMLGLKAATLATLPLDAAVPALVLGHTASRAAATALMAVLPYAGDAVHAKAKPLAQQVGRAEVVGAALWVCWVCVGLLVLDVAPASVLGVSLAGAAVAAAVCARWLRLRLGGFTGDTLGAAQQISELVLLLGDVGGCALRFDVSLHVWRHPKPIGALGLCIGRTDLAIDRRKAKRLAHRIRAHARRHSLPRLVVTSRLQRSAAVGRVLATWGWRHEVDAQVDEFDFGAWDGRPWAGIAHGELDAWSTNFMSHRVGGGESVGALLERVRSFIAANAAQRELSIVAHAGWISAALWLQAHRGEAPQASAWPAAVAYGRSVTLG